MMTDFLSIGSDLIKKATGKGASAADVIIVEREKFQVDIREGKIETLIEAGSKGLGLRLFRGSRTALSHTSDFSAASLERLLNDTLAMAQVSGEDPCNGLPEENHSTAGEVDLHMHDPAIDNLSPDRQIEMAREAEEIALQYDPRIIRSLGASFESYRSHFVLINSNGFCNSYTTTGFILSAAPQAEENGLKQTASWFSTDRFLHNLLTPEAVGKEAARRTVRKLGARKIKTQQAPVIYESSAAKSLLSSIAGAVSGAAVYRKASFLVDALESQIGSDALTVFDNGLLPEKFGSRPFDDEGTPSRKSIILQNGILKNYLLDSYSARKLNMQTTANASRSIASPPSAGQNNFYCEPGPYTPEEIIQSVGQGLYVTDLMGFGVNIVNGQYSRGAAGFWIENGELTYPVQEITISGTLQEMLKNIRMIGNDMDFRTATASPTLKVDSMIISGL